jgi:hypothetical protein
MTSHFPRLKTFFLRILQYTHENGTQCLPSSGGHNMKQNKSPQDCSWYQYDMGIKSCILFKVFLFENCSCIYLWDTAEVMIY